MIRVWIKIPIDNQNYRRFYPWLIHRKIHLDLGGCVHLFGFRQIQHVHRNLLMVRREVRVALGHLDVGVAEELGDGEKVDAFHRQVRGESVPLIPSSA